MPCHLDPHSRTTRLGVAIAATLSSTQGALFSFAQCEATLFPSDGLVTDSFATALDLDGRWAAVGNEFHDGPARDTGAVYMYEDRGDGVWAEVAKLVPAGAELADRFGNAVDLDGSWLAIGAYLSAFGGSVSMYRLDGSSWIEHAEIQPSLPANGEQFGGSVSLESPWLFVGAPRDLLEGRPSGACFVFRLDDNGTPRDLSDDAWIEHAKLTPSDLRPGDEFGISVAVDPDGDHAVVGSWQRAAPGASAAGAAYVFSREDNGTPDDLSDDVWTESAILEAEAPQQLSDLFGVEVAIADPWIAVGERVSFLQPERYGQTHMFRRTGTTWTREAILEAFDAIPAPAWYGSSLDFDGPSRLVVGAQFSGVVAPDAGAAYLYEEGAGVWSLQQKLHAAGTDEDDLFGSEVALDTGRVLVGASGAVVENDARGEAYIFDFNICPDALTLTIEGACPGSVDFKAGHAWEGSTIFFVYGFNRGSRAVPGCPGLTVDLSDPRIGAAVGVGPDGVAALRTDLPSAACGRVLVQAVDTSTCRVSNVMTP